MPDHTTRSMAAVMIPTVFRMGFSSEMSQHWMLVRIVNSFRTTRLRFSIVWPFLKVRGKAFGG
jgi:hypothetical protein